MILNTIVGLGLPTLALPLAVSAIKNEGVKNNNNNQASNQEAYRALQRANERIISETMNLIWQGRTGDNRNLQRQIETLQSIQANIQQAGRALGYNGVQLRPEIRNYLSRARRRISGHRNQVFKEMARVAWNSRAGENTRTIEALQSLHTTLVNLEEYVSNALGDR